MQTVQLQFDSIQHLWQFKETMQLSNFELRPLEKMLYCQLSAAAVELAIRHFGARRIEQLHQA
jgi:hypothetical protein